MYDEDYALQPQSVLAIILAGGRGARLADLTKWRVKPAVPFGGKYRIIDFTLSNCVNSGLRRMAVLTQYKSQSLIRHIYNGWNILNSEFGEFIEVIPAQKRNRDEWYQGTADSVYQNLDFIVRHAPRYTIILGGDHIYKMDYKRLLRFHTENKADVTVASVEVPKQESCSFGIMKADHTYRVTRFEEKPDNPTPLPGNTDRCLASMGIYVFNTNLLLELLLEDTINTESSHDFGKDIIPRAITSRRVFAWPYRELTTDKPAYWKDVGTVDSYWKANMDLVNVTPQFNLYDREWPVRSSLTELPPTKFAFNDEGRRGMAVDSIVAEGCIISGAYVNRSLVSSNVYIMDSHVENSVILPDVKVQRGSRIKNAVIDKYCSIPEDTVIGENLEEDRKWFHITPEGIVLVTPEMLKKQQIYQHRSHKQFLARRLKIDEHIAADPDHVGAVFE